MVLCPLQVRDELLRQVEEVFFTRGEGIRRLTDGLGWMYQSVLVRGAQKVSC